ncbi:MAG: hypothetical protein K2X38_23100 [Gemmataceae bacterium]|nr:hypothetical protein [Gemmataceae bacterium]
MRKKPALSRECLEALSVWIRMKCPCAAEDPEFFPGLWVIVEDEAARAVAASRQAVLALQNKPRPN